MREIKFRAWDKEKKTMIEVSKLNLSPGSEWSDCADCGLHVGINPTRFELMQYTGLKDKNGKEIHEGDIVQMNPDDDDWNDIVVFWCGRFELKSYTDHPRPVTNCQLADWCQDSDNPCIIIGNIYENPELLEDK